MFLSQTPSIHIALTASCLQGFFSFLVLCCYLCVTLCRCCSNVACCLCTVKSNTLRRFVVSSFHPTSSASSSSLEYRHGRIFALAELQVRGCVSDRYENR